MTADARRDKQDQFERKRRDAARLADDFQKELEKKEQGLLQKVLQDVQGVIERVGKERGYYLVVERRRRRRPLRRPRGRPHRRDHPRLRPGRRRRVATMAKATGSPSASSPRSCDAKLDGDPTRVVTGWRRWTAPGPTDLVPHRSPLSRRGARVARRRLPRPRGDVAGLPAPDARLRRAAAARSSSCSRLFHPAAAPPARRRCAPRWWPRTRASIPARRSGRSRVVEAGARIGAAGAAARARLRRAPAWRSATTRVVHPHVVLREGVRARVAGSSCTPARCSAPTASASCSTAAPTARFPRWAAWSIEDDVEIGANTTIDRATLRRHRSSGAAPRSTTSSRSATTSRSGEHSHPGRRRSGSPARRASGAAWCSAGQVGVGRPRHHRRRRDDRRPVRCAVRHRGRARRCCGSPARPLIAGPAHLVAEARLPELLHARAGARAAAGDARRRGCRAGRGR